MQLHIFPPTVVTLLPTGFCRHGTALADSVSLGWGEFAVDNEWAARCIEEAPTVGFPRRL